MARTFLVTTIAFLLLGAAPIRSAQADGINVARFLINHQRAQANRPPPSKFDRAFAKLQSARGKAGSQRLLMSRTSRHNIVGVANGGKRTRMTGKRELLFDGKRAYLRLTTSSRGLRPNVTSRTVRVPLGSLFGWYGKRLLKAQFPDLTPQKMQRALAR